MDYSKLVELYERLASTTKRLEKTYFLADFLKKTPADDLDVIVLLVQGKIFPTWDETKIGVASRMVIKAINVATGIEPDKIEKDWKKTGDLGKTAENLIGKKKQRTLMSQKLTVKKVFANLRRLPEMEGSGSVDQKIKLIAELLTSASPLEARYLVRTVLEELRAGVGEGGIRDSIVWAFFGDKVNIGYDEKEKKINPENREEYNKYLDAVQHAFDILNDFGEVAILAKTKGLDELESVSVAVGKPLKVMLFQKAESIKDAFERVGKPAACEFKYDGFRMEVHKSHGKIKIFTRRLDEVTKQFPEVVDYVEKYVAGSNFILDAEAVGFNPKTGKYLAFQSISQRIKRKYDIDEMSEKFPIELNVFDIIEFEGKSMLNEPFEKRRKLIEKIIKDHPKKLVVAKQLVTESVEKAEIFYQAALKDGQEGIMVKNLGGIYKPGSRVGFGVKVKPVMESLDLVIVGATWGEGKRSGWFTSFILACRDQDSGEFLEIGRVGTGIKELETEDGVSFKEMTEMLKPYIISEKGKEVLIKPKIVIEINFEEIQKSPTYSSGYALRFPRLVRVRDDKPAREASDLDLVEDLYHGQRGR